MRCATHPDIETNLRCSKCGKPLCPKCMVQTPVGARCQQCARLHKIPTYRVSTQHYLRAAAAGTGMALVCGFAWAVLRIFAPFFYVGLLVAAATGYGIGEVVGLSVNRKRGTGLAIVAGAAMVLAYFVNVTARGLLPGAASVSFTYYDLIAVALGVFMAVSRVR